MIRSAKSATDALEAVAGLWQLSVASEKYSDEVCAEESKLARSVSGDPDAFTVLYDRYYARILNYFHRRVRDRERAEDLTAQTFLSAFDYLSSQERQVHFRGWLYRVAHNAWVSHMRTASSWKERLLLVGERIFAAPKREPLEHLASRERIDLVHRNLLALPARYREPVMLRLYDELDYESISDILGISRVGARSRVCRGLEKLRQRLDPTVEADDDVD